MTDSGHALAPAAADPPGVGQPGSGETVAADGEILRALSRGDSRRALALCVQQHGSSIGRLCMAMLGAQGDADDVTQETLLAAYEAFGDFRREGTLRAWLLGIARNKCLQQLERQRRRGARQRLIDAPAASQEGELVQRAEQARSLLSRVRPSDRDALLLRYCGELSFKEVAAACGIEEATARKRVSRALLALRSTLKKESGDD